MLRRVHLTLLRVYGRLPRVARIWIVHRMSPGYSVGAICVVEREDGRVLLVRQSYRSAWGFPGGLLKRNELAPAAARREAKEEVGLSIELLGEPAVVVAPAPRRVDVVFRCRPALGADADAVTPCSPEITEVRWFGRDELPSLQKEAAGALMTLARAIPVERHGLIADL